LAEYYSTFGIEGETARVGRPIERHLDWLERRGVDLSTVLAADRRSAAYHEPGQVGGFYAGSWALVHYLLSGSTERLLRVADFFLYLDEGEDPHVAFERAFDLRLSTLEKELDAYLGSGELPEAEIPVEEIAAEGAPGVRRAAPADVLFHLGDLLLHMGRVQEAENHFHAALRHDPEHGASYGGLALGRDFHRRFEEAAVLYGDALSKGSSEPVTYLALGRHLLSRVQEVSDSEGDVERLAAEMERRAAEARGVLAVALELYPHYGEATVLLGLSHRLPGGEPEEGVRLLERARELLPERRELVVEQARQLGMLGERARGEALIEGALMARGRYELAEEARDALERESLLFEARRAFEEEEYERAIELFDQAISATRDPVAVERMEEQLETMQEMLGDG
jgi:tetratricopeptide (TPR) repeat protein